MGIRETSVSSLFILRVLKIFSKDDKNKLVLAVILQILIAFLDLLGIFLVGVVVSLALTETQTNQISSIFVFLKNIVRDFSSDTDLMLFISGFLAISFFALKTLLTIFISSKIFHFLSYRGSQISVSLLRKLFNTPLNLLRDSSGQEKVFTITWGVSNILTQVITPMSLLIVDVFMSIIILLALLALNWQITVLTLLVFSLNFFILFKYMGKSTEIIGSQLAIDSIKCNERIIEAIESYREIIVGNHRDFFINEIGNYRKSFGYWSAKQSVLPLISKGILEFGIILTAFIIASYEIILNPKNANFTILAIFLAAGLRMTPSALRIQQSLVQIKIGKALAISTLDLFENLNSVPNTTNQEFYFESAPNTGHFLSNTLKIEIKNLRFKYPDADFFAIDNLSLSIMEGENIAIVGASGAGKSTLIDLLLGIYKPFSGQIKIGNLEAAQAIVKWPGKISYIPQNINFRSGTLKENIALGVSESEIDLDRIYEVLDLCVLTDFVEELQFGIDTIIGEKGFNLSGGQRQRLAIARAIYSNPSILVMDESTSSLDSETEQAITKNLLEKNTYRTNIIVAHRLTSIKNADCIYYMKNGKIESSGNFETLREKMSDFNNQVELFEID